MTNIQALYGLCIAKCDSTLKDIIRAIEVNELENLLLQDTEYLKAFNDKKKKLQAEYQKVESFKQYLRRYGK